MDNQPVLLAVMAHPDDESFGIGGTLALYARRGVAVHLVCATRGEVGEAPPELMQGFASVADLRLSELHCAAAILGLAGVHLLDYRDSGMAGSPDNLHPQALAAAPLQEVASRVAHYIRQLRPHVVVTFDPNGGYKHPDHIAVHQATVLAFRLAADPSLSDELPPYQSQKLYYSTFPKRLLRFAVRLMPIFGMHPSRFGRNGDIDLASLVEESDLPIHARVNYRPVSKQRFEAAACHASQVGGGLLRKGMLGWFMRLLGGVDQYTRAYPPPQPGLHEVDLFEGIAF